MPRGGSWGKPYPTFGNNAFASSGATTLPDLNTLITNLGGTNNVSAIYDARLGVTIATGVSQWDDARGVGNGGPSLVQATGAKQPTTDGSYVIGAAASSQVMVTATSALFDLTAAGGLSIVLLGQVAAGITNTDGPLASIDDGASLNNIFDVNSYPNVNTNIKRGVKGGGGTYTNVDSGVAMAATNRLIIATWLSSSHTGTVQIPNQSLVTTSTTSAATAGNRALSIFSYTTVGSYVSAKLANVIVLPRVATAGDITALQTWATGGRPAPNSVNA
jgi:hypothetical protein